LWQEICVLAHSTFQHRVLLTPLLMK
jgi:hypothetical protein